MKLVGRRKVKDQKVYDIGLEGPHNFIIANGTVASNCFNKAHSYAYALIGYYEAYVKTHYPTEFYAALLSHQDDNTKVSRYIREAESLGIKVSGPNINTSELGFTPREGAVFYGFKGIKGMGIAATRSVLRGRGSTDYKDIWDFCSRVSRRKVNAGKIAALAKAGAFDILDYDREELLSLAPDIMGYYQKFGDWLERKAANEERARARQEFEALDKDEQATYRERYLTEHGKPFRKPIIRETPAKPEKPIIERCDRQRLTPQMLRDEREVLGCTITAHPTDFLNLAPDMCKVEDLSRPGQAGKVGVLVTNKRVIKTKKGSLMAFASVEDNTGCLDVIIFPNIYKKCAQNLEVGTMAVVSCRVEDQRQRRGQQDDTTTVIANHLHFIKE